MNLQFSVLLTAFFLRMENPMLGFSFRALSPILFVVFSLTLCVRGGEPLASAHYVVAANGSGDFTTIAAAVAAAKNPSPENPVTIDIKPGLYKEMVNTRDGVNLVGEDRDRCIISRDAGTDRMFSSAKASSTPPPPRP